MEKLPTLFISHGSPMLAIEDSPARRFLLELGKTLPMPKAILVASAHWETMHSPAVSLAKEPETIHDFGGFPDELFEMRYPVPGAPDIAEEAARLLDAAGLPVIRIPRRGLDHGAWVPLSLMYPRAGIPVAQISIVHNESPAEHLKIGDALAPLRKQGVLIVGSGSMTHNLRAFQGQPIDSAPPDWVTGFETWMEKALRENRRDELLDYRHEAPFAAYNHPTEEHLMPLFVAMGAAGDGARAQRLHASVEYGVLAMDVYAFSPDRPQK